MTDPEDQLRYWSGAEWTDRVAPLDAAQPPQFTVTRRNIYGNDMLYVVRADGTNVGRINLGTGKVLLERPELQIDFDRAVAAWTAEHPPVQAATDAVEVQTGAAPGAREDWRDLAENRPGEAVRRKAIEVRRNAPVKAFLGRLFGIKTDERAWRLGADGEEEVARRLARLEDGWKVIHSVVLSDGGVDIDHVAIGPGGVYTLNTKNHLGCTVTVYDRMILVNGQKTSYLSKSRAEGVRASRLLSAACRYPVHVEPIVVVICRDFRVKGRPDDVHVVGRRDIRRWLEVRPTVLQASAVEHIYDLARREATWRS